MLSTLWLTLLWPALARCHRLDFINGDGFVAVLGDSAKQPLLATTSFPQLPPWTMTSGETMFFVSRQTNATRLQATVAPGIVASAELSYSTTEPGGGGNAAADPPPPSGPPPLSVRHAVLLDNGVTLTAHVVTNSLAATAAGSSMSDGGQPSIDVVLHADGWPPAGGGCFRVLALRNGRDRVTASCLLQAPAEGNRSSSGGGSDSSAAAVATACLARLALPLDWTIGGGAVDVRFAQATGGTEPCFRSTNSVRAAAEEDGAASGWHSAGRVQLTAEGAGAGAGSGYKDVQEDQHVLLGMPDAVMRPGSTFTVPVKLQAESDLQLFITKIRTSKDLRLLDARTADTSTWSISFDHEERGGSVTALVRSSETYTKMPKVQDVFYCQFEVLQAAQSGADARITWTVEYESSYTDMNFVSTERKVITTRLKIGSDQIKHVVIAVKNNDLINLRLFRDQPLSIPFWVYSVSYTGALRPVGASDGAQCISRNPKILQVTKKCDGVFMPSGVPGSCGTASVDVQFAQRTRSITFRVWCPDERLVVKLSDDRLSEVREWRVPAPGNASSSRLDQTASDAVACRPRYQTAEVRVFTRFFSYDRDGQIVYYRGGGKTVVLSDITSMVQPFIRLADEDIATYKNGVVFGVAKGRTEVQVVLRGSRLVAAKDLQVLRARESLERFAVSVVSGASLSVSRRSDVAGIFLASLNVEEKLDSKHQEAVLDIWLKFTDGTFSAMSQFDPSDYSLEVESQNPKVVEIMPLKIRHQPRVRAVSTGRAMVKVTLLGPPECQLRTSTGTGGASVRALAVQYVHVAVDLGSGEELESGQPNGAMDYELEMSNDLGIRRPPGAGSKKGKETAYQNDAALPNDGNGGFSLLKNPGGGSVQQMLGPAAAGAAAAGASPAGKPVTPLDVGMYVVAGVLGVIVAVLAANCIVYLRRQKQSSALPDGGVGDILAAVPVGGAAPVKPSSGWVWIGRGTLEKHAVSTSCNELMPEPDFVRRFSQCALPGQTLLTSSTSGRTSCSVRRSSSCGAAGTSTYRGSECSVRITMTARGGDDDECCTGERRSGGGSSSFGAATTMSDAAFESGDVDGDDDDDRPIITPDDADGDSFGSEPLLAQRSEPPSAVRPFSGTGVGGGVPGGGGGSRRSSSFRIDAGPRDAGLAAVNRRDCDSNDPDVDQGSVHQGTPLVAVVAADVGLTQDEFDNLKESIA